MTLRLRPFQGSIFRKLLGPSLPMEGMSWKMKIQKANGGGATMQKKNTANDKKTQIGQHQESPQTSPARMTLRFFNLPKGTEATK